MEHVERPLISIIIPVYNHAKEACRLLCELEKQTYRPIEVVMVDDGSSDGLDERVKAVHPSFSFDFVRFETNRSAPVARNEGFRRSKGAYVMFLDADAHLVKEGLEKLWLLLQDDPPYAFSYSSFSFGGKLFRGRPFDPELLKRANYIHTSALIRREAFPGFDESLKRFQDWDLWLTMAKQGKKGLWSDEVLLRVDTNWRRTMRMSHWLPKIAFRIPWEKVGWVPKGIERYREAEAIIRKKHGI